MAWQHISPEVSVKDFKCISIVMDGIDALMLWNDSEENGDEEKMKALTVQMVTVTLIGKGG
jgi:hypothetical protein